MEEVKAELQRVKQELETLAEGIKSVETAIRKAQAEDNQKEVDALRDKESRLRDKEDRLRDKENRLRDKENLLLQQQLRPAPKPSFEDLLKQSGLKKPAPRILRLLELRFAQNVAVVSSPAGARELYEFAASLPGTSTKAALVEELGVEVGGPLFQELPLSSSALLSAFHSGRGSSAVLKVLFHARRSPSDVGTDKPLEAALCELLDLGPWDALPHEHFLVRASAVEMKVDAGEAGIFRRTGPCWAILMPRYSATLAEAGQLPLAMITAGVNRLLSALEFIHSRGFVHCDVKSANVLYNFASERQWVLSDFGSCTPAGEAITSTSEAFHPTVSLRVPTPATPEFDWQMLLCLFLVEVHKSSWKAVLMPPNVSRVCARLMESAYHASLSVADAQDDHDTRKLLCTLNSRAFRF